MRPHAAPSSCDFIRAPGSAGQRNHFSSFRRRFRLERVAVLRFHLFADSRYRLFVNGRFLGYGPARFVTRYPEYDSHDLTPYLRAGENEIRVELNFYGTSSYQTLPDGAPGWIGWSEGEGAPDLSTPGEWSCLAHHAWDPDAPLFSFAQNPAEVLDTRLLRQELDGEFALRPERVPANERPWGELRPRSTPMPAYEPMYPAFVRLRGPARDDLALYGFQGIDREKPARDLRALTGNLPRPSNRYRAFACWLHAPEARELTLHGFWAELYLNGEKIEMAYDHARGNHGVFGLPLRAGWNLLAAQIELLEEVWSWLMGWDRNSGVTLRAMPDFSHGHRFCLSPLENRPPALPPPGDPQAFRLPPGWTLDSGDFLRVNPARLAAWDLPAEGARSPSLVPPEGDILLEDGSVRLLGLDFRDQFYGHLFLRVEAPAGTVLDISYDDWTRPDGTVNLYGGNFNTNSTDRFVLAGGLQELDVLNPRGGIHAQLAFRLPHGHERRHVILREFFVRSRRTLRGHGARFSSGDPVLDWAVAASHHTLACSTDEAFSDCPWRERGTYIGDGWVNMQLLMQMSPDLSIGAHFLRLFARSQLPDGQLPACTPSWLRRPHGDFSLIWILALHDYWAATGDRELVRELWPTAERLWNSPAWSPDADGLWSGEHCHVFIDWGCPPREKIGAANTALNIFRVAAARALAALADGPDLAAARARFAAEADRVRALIESRLWIAPEGRFAPHADGTTSAFHANLLALRFGVGDAASLLAYLVPRLERNFGTGLANGREESWSPSEGHAEMYFLSYALPALAQHGYLDLALRLVREHYGYLRSFGYPTLNECFFRAHERRGSCCHSWSGAAALFAIPWIAGLSQREPGNPREWDLHAPPETFPGDRIEATAATRLGMLRLAWTRTSRGFQPRWTAPEGIQVRTIC